MEPHLISNILLVAGECVVAYPVMEALRLWAGWKPSVTAQYRLAWMVGLAVLCINSLALLVHRQTGVSIPGPSAFIHELWLGVLLYPVMAALTWMGILDLVPLISDLRSDPTSDRKRDRP